MKYVDRSPADVVDLAKLAEGGLYLPHNARRLPKIARIPYPDTVPKHYSVANEVATMALLSFSRLSTPKVSGRTTRRKPSISSWNSSKAPDLGEREIISDTRQLAQLESNLVSITFPAGGSLYHSQVLERVAGGRAFH